MWHFSTLNQINMITNLSWSLIVKQFVFNVNSKTRFMSCLNRAVIKIEPLQRLPSLCDSECSTFFQVDNQGMLFNTLSMSPKWNWSAPTVHLQRFCFISWRTTSFIKTDLYPILTIIIGLFHSVTIWHHSVDSRKAFSFWRMPLWSEATKRRYIEVHHETIQSPYDTIQLTNSTAIKLYWVFNDHVAQNY